LLKVRIEFNCSQRRSYKGLDGQWMERWKKICAAWGKWINSQGRLYKGGDGHSTEGPDKVCAAWEK